MQPDQETLERIKNLAYVGNALYEISNEVAGNTDLFLAKDALGKFKVGIDSLGLQGEILKGMQNLIEYLDKKLDKRIKASNLGTSLDSVV